MIAVAVIGSVAAIFFYSQTKLAPPNSTKAEVRFDKGGATAASKIPAIQAAPIRKYPLAANDSPTLALIREYESSTDKRKFYDIARLQPESGGAFLALKVAMECMLWVKRSQSSFGKELSRSD